MPITVQNIKIACPYCCFAGMKALPKHGSQPMATTCDPSEGGCGATYVYQATVKVGYITFKVDKVPTDGPEYRKR